MIRRYREGDQLAIARIYNEAIRRIASADYDRVQLDAWAGTKPDMERWKTRCERKRPFVKVIGGQVVGFMELDPDGHIDCTFVDPAHARKGVMSEIMDAAKDVAVRQGNPKLFAEVSITARPFFEKQGFVLVRDHEATINGVVLRNFIMEFDLEASEDSQR